MDLSSRAAAWNVTIDEVRETPTSLLGFGTRGNTRVVLKLSKHDGDESNSGAVLKAFGSDATVTVYESVTGAVLLERLDPGEQLTAFVSRGHDEEATKILAQTIGRLANHKAPDVCPTVADWGLSFDRYLQSGDQQISQALVSETRNLYRDLERTQRSPMLLHGDLQHYNVLFDDNRGWVAIDPKGVVGELEYEVGPILRNPVAQPQLFLNQNTIRRRLEILTTSLHLDYSRTVRWSFAQAVLSEIWGIEDGYTVAKNHPTLQLAHVLKTMIEKG